MYNKIRVAVGNFVRNLRFVKRYRWIKHTLLQYYEQHVVATRIIEDRAEAVDEIHRARSMRFHPKYQIPFKDFPELQTSFDLVWKVLLRNMKKKERRRVNNAMDIIVMAVKLNIEEQIND